MKFFIHLISTENADTTYDVVKQAALTHFGLVATNRRIFAIEYKHNGVLDYAEVGKIDQTTNEPIMVILETDQLYLMVTPSHGALKGEAMQIGKDEVFRIVDLNHKFSYGII